MKEEIIIDFIYLRYKAMYGFPQGYCGQIAEEIQKTIGGELVAGYLAFPSHNREHWWLDLDNKIIDPMSVELQKTDPHRHIEIHRDLSRRYWIKGFNKQKKIKANEGMPF